MFILAGDVDDIDEGEEGEEGGGQWPTWELRYRVLLVISDFLNGSKADVRVVLAVPSQ